MKASPSFVGPPMHAFRFLRELLKHVRASAQPHSDLLRFPKPPLMGRFLLARIGKPIAVTAGEQSLWRRRFCCAAWIAAFAGRWLGISPPHEWTFTSSPE